MAQVKKPAPGETCTVPPFYSGTELIVGAYERSAKVMSTMDCAKGLTYVFVRFVCSEFKSKKRFVFMWRDGESWWGDRHLF